MWIYKEKKMSRTMTQEECVQFDEFVEKKSKEFTKKQDIINFLHNVGFCDKKGTAVFPYNSSRKNK